MMIRNEGEWVGNGFVSIQMLILILSDERKISFRQFRQFILNCLSNIEISMFIFNNVFEINIEY